MTTIGNGTFCSCNKLTSLTIPEGVKTIGDKAFCGCNGLTSLTIPAGVTYIGKDAFYHCQDLVLTVERNTYAEQYCFDNKLKYIFANEETATPYDWLND